MVVKTKKRGRPTREDNQLSADSIISTAKAMMKNDGKVPSIRRLGAQLGVDAMAIYYYFKSKEVLLEAITTSLIREVYTPTGVKDWKQELNALCVSYLTLLDTYPGLLETLLTMKSQSPAMVFIERFNMIIKPLSLDTKAAENALCLLADYLHGFALALNCNKDRTALNTTMLEGPLTMCCIAIENANRQK